eukprot:g10698.t1
MDAIRLHDRDDDYYLNGGEMRIFASLASSQANTPDKIFANIGDIQSVSAGGTLIEFGERTPVYQLEIRSVDPPTQLLICGFEAFRLDFGNRFYWNHPALSMKTGNLRSFSYHWVLAEAGVACTPTCAAHGGRVCNPGKQAEIDSVSKMQAAVREATGLHDLVVPAEGEGAQGRSSHGSPNLVANYGYHYFSKAHFDADPTNPRNSATSVCGQAELDSHADDSDLRRPLCYCEHPPS